MSQRYYTDWIRAYLEYSNHAEAPRFMRFWAAVGTVAGALRKKVWIDSDLFRWVPNFFIIFVAPPGVVTKSTTIDYATDLLREVPGINFGPNAITWQALVGAFARAAEHFQYNEEYVPMSALTVVSRELGSLLNPKDRELVNLFIELWDGAKKYEKETKMSGNDVVEAPWINLLGATTPSWIAENMPSSMVGGGFVSRCIFLYAEEKEKFVAYPEDHIPKGLSEVKQRLIHDLEHIATNLCGPYQITREAKTWGAEWYEELWRGAAGRSNDDQVMGYIARKQTHLHKLAIVLAASKQDELEIDLTTLQLAHTMLGDIEADMAKVFARIGRSEASLQAEKLVSLLKRSGAMRYDTAYQLIHNHFPDFRDFEGVLTGLIRAGLLEMQVRGNDNYLVVKGDNRAQIIPG